MFMKKSIAIILSAAALAAAAVFLLIGPADRNNRETEKPVVRSPEKPDENTAFQPEDQPPVKLEDKTAEKPSIEKPSLEEPARDRGPKKLISMTSGELETIEFVRADEKIRIKKSGGQWIVNDGSIGRVDEGKILSSLNRILNLDSLETVAFSASGGEQWGISDQSPKIHIKKSGTLMTILLGSLNTGGTGYYIQIKGTDDIYLISSSKGESLQLKLDDIRDRTLTLFDIGQIETMTIKNSRNIKLVPYRRTDMFTDDQFSFMLEEPYRALVTVGDSELKTFLDKMKSPIKITGFIDSGSPGDYGISENSRRLTVSEKSGEIFELIIGDNAGSSGVYGKLAGEKQIFTLNIKDLPFLELKPFDLVDTVPHLISLNTIDTFMVTAEDLAIIGTIDRAGRDVYSVNGMEMTRKAFEDLYRTVTDLHMVGEVSEAVNRDREEIILSFKLYDGGSEWTHLNFYSYDARHYAVSRNEYDPLFLIERTEMTDMLESIIGTVDKLYGF